MEKKKTIKAVKPKAEKAPKATSPKAVKAKTTLDKMQEANKNEPRLEAKHPEMFTQELKIPRDRVGVLIGKKGEIKRMIQKRANVRLDISSDGDVVIRGTDTIMLYDVRTIVQAIGRGFAPEKAMRLFNESNSFEIIDVTLYTGKSKKKMERMRGRVIGENGRARASIEDLTETNISIYGKTVGIIGDMEMVALAREAIDMILSGAPHGATYRMVENKRREIHKRRLEAMYHR
ncbi:MAG: KH domain-containing protein [Nanoarchaeota archaeon]